MKNRNWIIALLAVMACGLIAAGCGSSDDSSSATVEVTGGDTAMEDTTSDDTAMEDTTSDDGGGTADAGSASPDDVYNACVDAIEGTAAESAAMPTCEKTRDAFQQCLDQADSIGGTAGDTAKQICQDAADKAITTLEGAS